MAWSGLFGTLTLVNLVVWLAGQRPDGPADIVLLAAITAAPLLPVVGFHLNQALRQFRGGHTLGDLQTALEIGRRDRAETEAIVRVEEEPLTHRVLRLATVGSATWLAVTFVLILSEVVHERELGAVLMVVPMLTTLVLGAVSNALDVQFIPTPIRKRWQTGIRERLWNSRVGEWLARRLGAPERSKLAGASAFRATEAMLGVAAAELFAALPKEYREHLEELPAIVAALEAHAAEARAEIEVVAALVPSGSAEAEVLATRKNAAAAHLAESVAALEKIRLDLLRLHAGSVDLSPLTTLMDAARLIGEDVSRLAEAEREVEDALGRRLGARRTPTPV
jgi:serine/threonine-protein kinase